MLYLTTDPHQHDQVHLLYYVKDSAIENLLMINYEKLNRDLAQLNLVLTRSFQHLRPNYEPIPHRNHIAHLHTFSQAQIDELTLFNTELNRALRDEDHVYLIQETN